MKDHMKEKILAADERYKERDYWLEKLSGELVKAAFPYDYDCKKKAAGTRRMDAVSFHLSDDIFANLKKLSSASDAALHIILTSALVVVLGRYTGANDIIVGTPIYKQEVEGDYINTVLTLRTALKAPMTFKDLLLQMRETVMTAVQNQNYPLETLLYHLDMEWSERDFPLFDIVVLLENIHDKQYIHHIKTNMVFSFRRTDQYVEGIVEYDRSLYRKGTVEKIAAHLQNLVHAVTSDVEADIHAVNILLPEEERQLLKGFNDNRVDFPCDRTVFQLIEDHAAVAPDRAAACFEDKTVTYWEFNRKANRWAKDLRAQGVKRQDRVGIVMNRSIFMMESILAAWKAGAAYIPIEPSWPGERIKYILEDCRAAAVLTEQEAAENRPLPGKIHDNPEPVNQPADVAYIIYTSGSTGKPKGAVVEHIGMMNHMQAKINDIKITARSIVAQNASHTFDISVWQFFAAPACGGKTVIYGNDLVLEPDRLISRVIKDRVTVLEVVPSYLSVMLDYLDSSGSNHQTFDVLRYLLVTGETVKPVLLQRWFEKYPGIPVVNAYGPTEASDDITHHTMDRPLEVERVPIGKPVQNFNIYIVDEHMNLCPMGVKGEICVAGVGVGRGYLNDQQKTGQAFGEDPFAGTRGIRLFKTGDIGCWLPDGTIDFFGRKDYQVKIRGFRIELGEIETRLLGHEKVKEAVVVDREDEAGNKYLCAYIVPNPKDETLQLEDYLMESLPDYMVPSYFVQLEKIPLTPNGKVDRKALPQPELKKGGDVIAPRNDLEKTLADIWSEVLRVDRDVISIDFNFFELGGHSLSATILASKIHKELKVKLSLAEVFRTPTIREIAGCIKEKSLEEEEKYEAIEPVEKREYYALSSAQKRLYILQQMDLESTAYNVPEMVPLPEDIDLEKLEKNIIKLIERHESLRTSFFMVADEPVQRIHDHVAFSMEHGAWSMEGGDFIRPFDLSLAPLLRVGVVETDGGGCLLVVVMHHIISDGISHDILVEDFNTLYAGEELPPLRLQYKDFAQWQNGEKETENIRQQEVYWLRQFEDEVPVLDLSTDYVRPVMQRFEGSGVTFKLAPEVTANLKKTALDEGATLYMVLLAVFTIFLAKVSHQEDIVVGTPVAGRSHPDLEKIMGMFVNTLAIRNYPIGMKTFAEFLKEVKERALDAFENQDYPFEDLVEKVTVTRDMGRNPLFDVMFVLQNLYMDIDIDAEMTDADTDAGGSLAFDKMTAKFDLTLNGVEFRNGLLFSLRYSTHLFKKETAGRFVRYLKAIFMAVHDDVNKKISEIDILSPGEKKRILDDFNCTTLEYPADKTIHELFAEQVRQTPDNIAIQMTHRTYRTYMTYDQLNKKSHQLARLLTAKGVRPDTVVGIMVERSIEMVTGMLGILKAGGAYLPIDPQYPGARINFMLRDSGAKILLSKVSKVSRDIEVIDPKKIIGPILNEDKNLPTQPTHLCYLIYTSGSTGTPKGVMVTHRNVVNLVSGLEERVYHHYKRTLRICLIAPYVFDASVKQVFASLVLGHSLYIVPEEARLDGEYLLRYYKEHQIDISDGTPTHLRLLLESVDGKPLAIEVKHFLIGGESLPKNVVEAFFSRFAKHAPKITNVYGPTECSVDSTCFEVTKESVKDFESIPIGKPMPNYQVYIMGRGNQLQPIGIAGELWVSGVGAARGYLNNPELTAEKFFNRSYRSYRSYISYRSYRTGDLARWLPDGNIEFLGRADHQVKIRGYRIELEEIENCLLKHPEIKEAVVLTREKEDRYLCAYIVPHSPHSPYSTHLKEHLSRSLPDYMIPSYFVEMDTMPLTSHGKVDRKALPAPVVRGEGEYAAPTNPIEVKLVELWSELLAFPGEDSLVGIEDNFFQLGGHSLKAIILLSKIHKELNVKVPLAELFKTPTIKGLSGYIMQAAEDRFSSIEPAEERDFYALSSVQKRLYILQQMDPESTVYNMPEIIPIGGGVDVEKPETQEKMENTFKQLIKRHESLRTSFHMISDEPVQKIHDTVEFSMEHGAWGMEVSHFVRSFDLSCAPLLRVGLIKSEEVGHLLLVDMHHIISDAVSHELLVKDFIALYQGQELPKLRLQYKDFAQWQNSEQEKENLRQQETYWMEVFSDEGPVLELPTDYKRPFVHSFEGDTVRFGIGKEETGLLKRLALAEGATLYMVLLAVYNVLLSKLSRQEDIVVGTPVAGRRHADLEKIIGMFVNTLPLRNYPQREKTFRGFLNELKERTLEAFENQEYPFEELVDKVGIKRQPGRHPLVDVMFVLQTLETVPDGATPEPTEEELPGSRQKEPGFGERTAKFDLMLYGQVAGEKLFFVFEYSTKLFKKETIERYAGYFKEILSSVLANRDMKLEEVKISHDLFGEEIDNPQVDFDI